MSEDYDILIKDATIVDGSGSKPYKGAVAVKGERIAAVGKVEGDLKEDAKVVIDAEGLMVTPGFIDVHNHGDLSILYYPKADGYGGQGITTFVGGNCGSSPAPYGNLVKVNFFLGDLLSELNPDMYYPEGLLPRDVVNERHREMYGWEIDWHTMGEFLKRVEDETISPNYVPLVGHHDESPRQTGHGRRVQGLQRRPRLRVEHLRRPRRDRDTLRDSVRVRRRLHQPQPQDRPEEGEEARRVPTREGRGPAGGHRCR
jgi:N-acyl-D-aspartate/D-glutamate deacylase